MNVFILLLCCNLSNLLNMLYCQGCLCASYIGGSINFFATANIISKQMKSLFPTSSIDKASDLFSAMAAADLLVMAIYFGGLSVLLSSKRLRMLFPGRQMEIDNCSTPDNDNETVSDVSTAGRTNRKSLLCSGIAASLLTLTIVEASIVFEKYTSHIVPGMGCAAVAALGTLANTSLSKFCRNGTNQNQKFACVVSKFREDLARIGSPMSDFCFMILFAAIGISANLGKALTHGISSFAFAILALCIHVITVGLGSFSVMRLVPKNSNFAKKIFPLALEEVLVASNAAIGGASTAAAFAGNLGEDRVINGDRKRGLILAATLWGVVGYACATTIGVWLTKMLAIRLH